MSWITALPKRLLSALAFCLAVLSCSILVSACAIRTSQAEHYLGPVLYTTGRHATVQSMSEQLHFPLLAEVGTQWGLSVGVVRRVRAVPLILNTEGAPDPANQPEHLISWGLLQLSSNTFLSPLYLRVTPSEPPEFLVRSVVGASIGVGSEQNTLTAGMKHMTEFRPVTSGIHFLCYQSARPGRMSYVVSEQPELFSRLACGRTSPS